VILPSINGCLYRYRVEPDTPTDDVFAFYEESRGAITDSLKAELAKKRGVKFWICTSVTYRDSVDETKTIPGYHCSKADILLSDGQIDEALNKAREKIKKNSEEFQEKGSAWVVAQVGGIDIHIAKYRPLRASSFKKLPTYIAKKEAIVNPKNRDQRCFIWAVLIGLHPMGKNAERVSKYRKLVNKLHFDGINMPVAIDDVSRFEEQNEVSVNVYTCEDHDIYPLHITKKRHDRHNLFYYDEHY